jgi:hypothetical protein
MNGWRYTFPTTTAEVNVGKGGISVSIEGVTKTVKGIQEASQIKINYIIQAINGSALIIEGKAKRACPVDQGRLRASIRTRFERSSGNVASSVYTDVDYAKFIEEGTGVYNVNGRRTPWVYKNAKGQFRTTRGYKGKHFLLKAFNAESAHLISNIRGLLSS